MQHAAKATAGEADLLTALVPLAVISHDTEGAGQVPLGNRKQFYEFAVDGKELEKGNSVYHMLRTKESGYLLQV